MKKFLAVLSAGLLACALPVSLAGCAEKTDTVVLRVCSWEEYIDLGEWEDDEKIEIENPYIEGSDGIFGENSMVEDFEEWFNDTHDFNVRVEYSTFGTNEDLYNRLSLGDVYDLVCPSDYMLMKLIAEDKVEKFSEEFFNGEYSWYAENVSPYIGNMFESYGWDEYAACYMWGTTGLVYNPERIEDVADVSTWNILLNGDYKRQVTVKDNVRDAYFATLGIINGEQLLGGVSDEKRSELLNDTESGTIVKAEDVLKQIKENVYSFETDAGKSDMVTGKVIANYQWSGDAVYIMDEAESDENNSTELWYSVPDECANLWFDGWVMLKDGIDANEQRQTAAEAFVNFLSRPDNAVRNMNYIGYTSAIAGDTVLEYMDWNYGATDETEKGTRPPLEYDLSYFFGYEAILLTDSENFEVDEDGTINRGRQLFAQYPPENVIGRSVVMLDFGDKLGEINQMWINVRCLDLLDISPVAVGVTSAVAGVAVIGVLLYVFRYRLFINYKPKKGYEKVEKTQK